MNNKRFDTNAHTIKGAAAYLTERAIQLLKHDVYLKSLEVMDDGKAVIAHWDLSNHIGGAGGVRNLVYEDIGSFAGDFASIYLLPQYQGNGKYRQLVEQVGSPIVTHVQCGLATYLQAKGLPYIVFSECHEYDKILAFYGDKVAARSQQWYMRHIDEGCAVINWHYRRDRVRDDAIRAFCLHPLVQRDEDLAQNWRTMVATPMMTLAMEYRAVANAALAHRPLSKPEDIALSVLPEVNAMLIGDKVQNRKDFELYHKDTHPNSDTLDKYFRLWLKRLGIGEHLYWSWNASLQSPMRVLRAFQDDFCAGQ